MCEGAEWLACCPLRFKRDFGPTCCPLPVPCHCRCAQDIASPDEEWVEGVHAATQAAQEDLLISNTRLIGSGQGAYEASRMSTVRQLRMLVSLREMTVAGAHAACSICSCGTLSQPRWQRAASPC